MIINDSESQFVFSANSQTLIITKTGSVFIENRQAAAIVANGFSDLYVVNEGFVDGGLDGLLTYDPMQINNGADGEIDGYRDGVRILTSNCRLTNAGTITGGAEGVHDEGSGIAINNSGSISGALGMYVNTESGTGTVVNSGLITGDATAFYKEGGGTLSLRNSGKIDGNITLVDGTNNYDGRTGTVTGLILGGTGADTVRAGNDGETIAGGAGHDNIFGGTGADTFAFTSFAGADFDRIHSFGVANDTIQLDHTVFTKLKVDTPPTFAIGAQASSPTDYLFYNTQSGALSYDVDGSGSTYAPHLVASLDPGLKLTAANFSIV